MKKLFKGIVSTLLLFVLSYLAGSAIGLLLFAPGVSYDKALSSYTLCQAMQDEDEIVHLMPPGYFNGRVKELTENGEYTRAEAEKLVSDCYESVVSPLCRTEEQWKDGVFSVFQNVNGFYTPEGEQLRQLADALKKNYGVRGRITDAQLISLELMFQSKSGAEFSVDVPLLMVKSGRNWSVLNMFPADAKEYDFFSTLKTDIDWVYDWFRVNCPQSLQAI